MGATITIIALITGTLISIGIYELSEHEYPPFIIFIILMLMFALGIAVGHTDITTQNIVTYTYECQICEETKTQTEEPKIMICDECKEAIKNIKNESEDEQDGRK